MTRAIGWLCFRIVMAWPLPLPDCRENRAFAWILARAGEYADPMMPNAAYPTHPADKPDGYAGDGAHAPTVE